MNSGWSSSTAAQVASLVSPTRQRPAAKDQGLAQTARLLVDGHLEASRCVCLDEAMTKFEATTTSKDLPPDAQFATVLADPPWRFVNRTGKVAPEHRRLSRYETMTVEEIARCRSPASRRRPAHLYLWVPNALLAEGLEVMAAWGFTYKTNLVWHKVRKDGGSDGRGVGFYFRNVTELLLFGTRGKNARTLAPGRRQINLIATRKREHSRKPDELYAHHRGLQPGAVPRAVRPRQPAGWTTGATRRRRLPPDLGHLRQSFRS